MDEDRQLALDGVRFFGEMSATVSHDIKNVLAIINENAGLLQDMLAMHARGMALNPERLETLAQSIDRQVARGDRMVKNMNQLAHSADHPTESVDVVATIGLLVDLAGRLIAMKGQAPHIEAPEAPVTVITNRFFLQRLIWACLCRALDACAADRRITISVEKAARAVHLRFSGLPDRFVDGGTPFPSPRETAAARVVNASISADESNGQIIMILN